jgi:hypothetical protein
MTFQIASTQGLTSTAVAISCAAGEELTLQFTLLTSTGLARDCSGGTLSFSFERPSKTGTPIRTTATGQSSGIHTITILETTTRLLDGQYTWDAWFTPANGAPEKLVLNGAWTVTPAVGSGGDQIIDTLLQEELDAIQSHAIRVYPTCAAVRADATAYSANPTVAIAGRGVFTYTASAGTDTGTEDTTYVTSASGTGGFAMEGATIRDYTSPSADPPYKAGRIWYRNESLWMWTEVTDVSIRIGETQVVKAYNGGSTTIAKGSPVYVYGQQGMRLDVRPFVNGAASNAVDSGLAVYTSRSQFTAGTSSLYVGSDPQLTADLARVWRGKIAAIMTLNATSTAGQLATCTAALKGLYLIP